MFSKTKTIDPVRRSAVLWQNHGQTLLITLKNRTITLTIMWY